MKFASMKLRNWRSFYGEHFIEFSRDESRPLTLLLGPNGAGKTAILNAFTWCLYGHFTPGFKGVESLINLDAIRESEDATALVEIRFVHHADEYLVTREVTRQEQSERRSREKIQKNGVPKYPDEINAILPGSLSEIFFFDSETFTSANVLGESSNSIGASLDVRRAIRAMLAGDIYDNAQKDLESSIDHEELKRPRGASDQALAKADQTYQEIRARHAEKKRRDDALPRLIAETRTQILKAEEEARKFDPERVEKWRLEYDRLKGECDAAASAVTECEQLFRRCSRVVFRHFSSVAVRRSVERLNIAERLGLTPPRIHESLLQRSLSEEVCAICKGPLDGSAIARLTDLLKHVANQDVAIQALEARSRLQSLLSELEQDIAATTQDIASLCALFGISPPDANCNLSDNMAVLRSCWASAAAKSDYTETLLDEFRKSSTDPEYTEGNNPVDVLQRVQRKEFELVAEKKKIEQELVELHDEEAVALQELKAKSSASQKHRVLTEAISLLNSAKEFFDTARAGLLTFGRQDFEKAINQTFGDLVRKPFEIVVREDFRITVVQRETGDEISVSQSESVLVLIAFLGAIARLAPHYETIAMQKKQFSDVGSVQTSRTIGYPVVLDAPTSPFDGEYEVDVVRALPELLPQVIVPVSAKSISVWEEVSNKIGTAYVLEVTSSSSSDRPVQWNGQDFRYSIHDPAMHTARTRIVRVSE